MDIPIDSGTKKVSQWCIYPSKDGNRAYQCGGNDDTLPLFVRFTIYGLVQLDSSKFKQVHHYLRSRDHTAT